MREDQTRPEVIVPMRCSVTGRDIEGHVARTQAGWEFLWIQYRPSLGQSPIDEKLREAMTGPFTFDSNFEGCPACRGRAIARCTCGRMGCAASATGRYYCSWCGVDAMLTEPLRQIDGRSGQGGARRQ